MNNKQIDILNDFFLHRALHLMALEEQCLRKICAKDLSVRELHVLEAVISLCRTHKNTMAEVARYLHLSPASLTTAVNVLVRKGYLTREFSTVDRRVIFIMPTDAGFQANRRYLDFVCNMVGSAAEGVDEPAAEAMIGTLTRLNVYLEEGSANGEKTVGAAGENGKNK